jgi:hypothetical protein
VLARLLELRAAHVDASDVLGRPHHLGDHARHGADATAEIGDTHARHQSRLRQHASALRTVDMMQCLKATNGGFTGRK